MYLLRLGDGLTFGAPPDHADRLSTAARDARPDELYSADAARDLVGDDAGIVLGPSQHTYVDAATFSPPGPCDARRLGPRDADAFARFRSEIADDEWHEGGFAEDMGNVTWGAFEGGRLVAMGNMTDFGGAPADVGVVTHPSARGRGIGTRLVGTMVAEALASVPVVRYRALVGNTASLAIADRLGFVADGSNIAVRLRT